ncbi:Hypothetical_protein [Hexamita inflata]|uniref:Hypothetical_protein n=1 Tax=Hexamita inflata TaxID=28002 RepID=A0AA86QQH2_9EUKA|nr:Hypothetical protein HINF_LOCUS43735 [Hexamita inflata]
MSPKLVQRLPYQFYLFPSNQTNRFESKDSQKAISRRFPHFDIKFTSPDISRFQNSWVHFGYSQVCSHSNLKAGISNLFLARLHAICVCHHFKEDFDCFPKILPSFSEIQLFTLFNRYFVIFIMATLDFSLVRFILELLKTRIQNIQKNISFNSILKFIQTFIIQYSNYYRNFIIFLMADL